MNVYPVNAAEAAAMSSPQKAPHSLIGDLYNRYMAFQVDFISPEIELSGNWNSPVEIDAVIIGNTNAGAGTIRLYDNEGIVFEHWFVMDEYLKIIQIKDGLGVLRQKEAGRFVLALEGNDSISLGYLFFGRTWELPRFAASPADGLNLRNESGRTFGGQVTGIPVDTLKSFSVQFVRIDNAERKKFNDYVNGVQTVVPHVVDPYPEAHAEFAPFFATVQEYGEAAKRRESGFLWDLNCSWLEAK
jgi:hypothetical protein